MSEALVLIVKPSSLRFESLVGGIDELSGRFDSLLLDDVVGVCDMIVYSWMAVVDISIPQLSAMKRQGKFCSVVSHTP
jgi:hypothetical protein